MLMMYRSAVPPNNNYRMFLIVNHLSQSQLSATTFCWTVEGIIWIAIHLPANRLEGPCTQQPGEHLRVEVWCVLAKISDRGCALCPAEFSAVLAILLDGTRTFCWGQNRLGFTNSNNNPPPKKKPSSEKVAKQHDQSTMSKVSLNPLYS